jgi:hypothetical protein
MFGARLNEKTYGKLGVFGRRTLLPGKKDY